MLTREGGGEVTPTETDMRALFPGDPPVFEAVAAFSLLLAGVLSCALLPSSALSVPFNGWGFQAQIPSGVSVKEESEGETDFALYHFLAKADKVLLSIYVGNHPDCPQLAEVSLDCDQVPEVPGTVNDKRAKQGDRFSREGLLMLGQENPALLHFWYSDLTTQERDLADHLIGSIE